MLAASLCIIFALCCPVVHADPVSVDISSAFDWSRELLARCVLSEGDYRIVLAGRSVPVGETGANEARVLAGLSSSWIRIGPLSPAGVLREACNPLGFQAGSDVFVQRSGFVVDSSFPAQSAGALVMPIARSLGAFYRQLPDGGEWVGCMASAFQRQGASLEGFISLARPPCESMGEEWIADSAPFAGGRILTSAARILAESRPFGMTATLGASLPETSLPGGFFNLHLWARTEGLKLFFLLSKADSTYISPSGDHSPDAGRSPRRSFWMTPAGRRTYGFHARSGSFRSHRTPFLPVGQRPASGLKRAWRRPLTRFFQSGWKAAGSSMRTRKAPGTLPPAAPLRLLFASRR